MDHIMRVLKSFLPGKIVNKVSAVLYNKSTCDGVIDVKHKFLNLSQNEKT